VLTGIFHWTTLWLHNKMVIVVQVSCYQAASHMPVLTHNPSQ